MQLLPITSLYLDLPSATSRAHFKNLACREAPIHDADRHIKRWADPSKLNLKPDARVSYLIFAGGELVQIEMSAFEAVNVNLPAVIEDGAFEVGWPCRSLAADERIVCAGNVAMVEKGTQAA